MSEITQPLVLPDGLQIRNGRIMIDRSKRLAQQEYNRLREFEVIQIAIDRILTSIAAIRKHLKDEVVLEYMERAQFFQRSLISFAQANQLEKAQDLDKSQITPFHDQLNHLVVILKEDYRK